MAQGQLTAEELEALIGEVEAEEAAAAEAERENRPFTGAEPPEAGGYYPEMDRNYGILAVDRMETPITEDERDNPIIAQVVESEEYKNATDSFTRNKLIEDAILESNMTIYRGEGKPAMGTGEGTFLTDTLGAEVRTQRFETDEGPRTYFVPKPGAESTTFQRGVSGGLLKGAQEIGSFVERNITDPIGITDSETNYVRENFPTYAPEDAIDKTIQEVVSIVAGAAGGAGVAAKLDKVAGLTPKMSKYISKFWDDAKKVDPKQAQKKLELFLKGLLLERGSSVGATLTTPEGTDPLVGDTVVEALGMDPEENERLAHYVDNEAFAFGTNVLFRAFGAAGRFGSKLFRGIKVNPEKQATEIGLLVLKQIDPNITNEVPGTILAERARIMGQVMMDNKDFRLGVLGQRQLPDGTMEDILPGGAIQLDSGTALMIGAREYAERAYSWRKALMGETEYEKMIDGVATEVANNIVSLKRGRQGSEIVKGADNVVTAQAEEVLTKAADEAAGGVDDAGNVAGQQLGESVSVDVVEARRASDIATQGVESAEARLAAQGDRDAILRLLEDAKAQNVLGDDATERALLADLTGPKLLEGFEASRAAYNKAFDDLPAGIEVDIKGLKTLLDDLSTQTNNFDSITVRETAADPFRTMLDAFKKQQKVGPDGKPMFTGTGEARKPVMETDEDVLARIGSDVDLKVLYTQIRPEISRRINLLQEKGVGVPKQLTSLKEWIDKAAEESGDTSFRAAMDLYEEYANTYLRTEPLRQYDAAARNVTKEYEVAPGVRMGEEDAYVAGQRALEASSDNPIYFNAFIDALNKANGQNVSATMAQAYVGQSLKMLSRSVEAGQPVTADQIRTSVLPYLDKIRGTAPDYVKMFEDTVSNLEMLELGLLSAKEVAQQADEAYSVTLRQAQEDAASAFVRNIDSGVPTPLQDTGSAWRSIFNAKDAPEKVEELLQRAASEGNQLALDGIKSKYLQFLKEKIFTKSRTGVNITEEGTGSVKGLSAAQLQSIAEGNFDNTLTTLRNVFKDEPEKAGAVTRLIELLNISVNNRAVKGSQFGSDTAYNTDLKKTVDRIIVLTLGVLNPAATKARNLSAIIVEGKQQQIKEAIERNLDLMITNPEYFSEVMRLVAKDATDEDLLASLSKFLTKRGVLPVSTRETDDADPIRQMDEDAQ